MFYKSQHKFILVCTAILLLIIGIMLYLGRTPRSADQTMTSMVTEDSAKVSQVTVNLQGTEQSWVYQVDIDQNVDTVFSTLQKLASDHTIALAFEQTSLGLLITSINEETNGVDNKYWLYKVNGEYGQVAADQYALKEGDKIDWSYQVPDYNN